MSVDLRMAKKLSVNSGCAPSASESGANKAGKAAHIDEIWVALPNAGRRVCSRAKATRGLQTASKNRFYKQARTISRAFNISLRFL